MPKKRIITKAEYDALGDAGKEWYTQLLVDGKPTENYVIDDGEGSIDGLKGALNKERTKAEVIEGQLKALGVPVDQIAQLAGLFAGMDAEGVKKALDTYKKAQDKKLIEKGDYDAMLQQVQAGFAEKEKAWEAERSEIMGTLESALLDTAIATAAGLPEIKGRAHLLIPLLKSQGMAKLEKITGTGGKVEHQPRFYDPKIGLLYGNDGQPLGPKDFLSRLRGDQNYAPLFEAAGGGGGGATQAGLQPGASTGAVIKVERAAVRQDAGVMERARTEAAKTGATVEVVGE